MSRLIIAIIDTVTNDIAGPLQIFPHEAPAVRMFRDVAAMPDTMVARHLKDHELRVLGTINDDLSINGLDEPLILITGAALLAATETAE